MHWQDSLPSSTQGNPLPPQVITASASLPSPGSFCCRTHSVIVLERCAVFLLPVENIQQPVSCVSGCCFVHKRSSGCRSHGSGGAEGAAELCCIQICQITSKQITYSEKTICNGQKTKHSLLIFRVMSLQGSRTLYT